MKEHPTHGIYCPTLTPVDDRGAPCVDLLLEHCFWLLEEGCSGIVLFGTTGEANSFTSDERRALLEAAVEGGLAPGTLMVGTGCCAVGETVALTKHALSVGVNRVLVLPPFYYKNVVEGGVIDAYSRTIAAVDEPLLRFFFYRIPQLSGVDIGATVVKTLVDRFPNTIAGLKDSSGDWESTERLCTSFGSSLDVLVGSERFLTAALAAGAAGCVTATANVTPRALRELQESRDASAQRRAIAVRDEYEKFPMIPALKAAVAARTGDRRWRNVRPPLVPFESEEG